MIRRIIAGSLSALLVALAPGLRPYELLAQEVVRIQTAQTPGNIPALGVPVSPGGAQSQISQQILKTGPASFLPTVSNISVRSPAAALALPASTVSGPAAKVISRSAVPSIQTAHPDAAVKTEIQAFKAPQLSQIRKSEPVRDMGKPKEIGAAAAEAGQPQEKSLLSRLALPSLINGLKAGAGIEDARRAAAKDFGLRTGESAKPADALHEGEPALSQQDSQAQPAERLLDPAENPAESESASPIEERKPQAAPAQGRQRRWALFPALMTGLSAAGLALITTLHWAATALLPHAAAQALPVVAAGSILGPIFTAASAALAVSTGLLGVWAAWDIGLFVATVARGAKVSDAQFRTFAKKELQRWGLHPSVVSGFLGYAPGRGILKTYRPNSGRFSGFSLGLTQGGSIYVRPELARAPRLFRWVLKHEIKHYLSQRSRAPPAARSHTGKFFDYVIQEVGARLGEWRTNSSMKTLRIPVIDRVLNEAQISLKLKGPYEVLVVHPSSEDLRDPATYRELSSGRAKVTALRTAEGAQLAVSASDVSDYFGKDANQGRFRFIVLPQAHGALPADGTLESKRLDQALKILDDIYMLAHSARFSGALGSAVLGGRPVSSPGEGSAEKAPPGSVEAARLRALAHQAGISLPASLSSGAVNEVVAQLYREFAQERLKGFALMRLIEGLYRGLQDRGAAFLPFAEGDPGLPVVEKLLRYWEASDSGHFLVQRVDLAEGGHVLVARKIEPRVSLWLKPVSGASIARSETNLDAAPEADQEGVLRTMGFSEREIERFGKAGMKVRHVFGADVGQNRAYVTVHKAHAKAIRRYADTAGIRFEPSRGGYALHLIESPGVQNVAPVWKLRIRGEGGRIYDIDTGLDASHPDFADRALQSIDFVNEGPEDWIGHGTHKAGISYANGTIYKGMAPAALGRMGKVFSRSGLGASDGDIMAAAVDALKWGADVVSLSLGSPGTADSPLAEFFSDLTRKKTDAGEFPIGTGSAGNSGPFNRTLSQPSVGVNMISVAAAAKSRDDAEPEIAFYSSVGPALDNRYHIRRVRMKPEITALGGDVTTPPGVKDVYEHGIESVKSVNMPPGPSDTKDALHTRMSGTSMSNPQIAGIALLVKQAVKMGMAAGSEAAGYFLEHLPFSVKMILMRSAADMRVPVFFQGAGFVDALAAVKLAARTFGSKLGALARAARALAAAAGLAAAPAAAPASSWDWISRAEQVWKLEDQVFDAAEAAWKGAQSARQESAQAADNPEEPSEQKPGQAGPDAQAASDAMLKSFAEARAQALPKLLASLKDEVWLVRFYAAFALMNLKAPEAALDLAEAALNDPDGRVRQAAFLAIAETPGFAADELLRKALGEDSQDIGMYSAYVLARHGDASGIRRIIMGLQSADKKVRFSAAWLLGQAGSRATTEASDALAGRLADEAERGNIRHLCVASLTEMADSKAASVTDKAVVAMLDSSGPQNFALTRTVSKFFKTAARKPEFRERLKGEALKSSVLGFIQKHKGAANRPGALGEMVQLLARIVNVPLDLPTPAPDKNGSGVPGVDPNLGPIHLLVEMPSGPLRKGQSLPRIEKFRDFRTDSKDEALSAAGEYGLETETLKRFEAKLQVAMPNAQALWVNVPEAKAAAFTAELEAKGYKVRRARPFYGLIHETGPLSGMPEIRRNGGPTGKGVLIAYLDEGGDTAHPAIDASRIKFKKNFSGEGKEDEVADESIGHGTHGMGIVGARSVDGSPYVGMAPDVDFAIGKVLGANGGTDAMVMAGMEWAASLVDDPLKTPVVVNMSLGGPGNPDDPLSLLVNKLRLKNITVIAAAGNEGPAEGTVGSPANAALAIRIGAADKAKGLTFYSSRGVPGKLDISWVDFGGAVAFNLPNPYEIVSTLATKLVESLRDAPTTVTWKDKALYQTMSGTSMAAPHSTGKFAALIERMASVMAAKFGRLPDGYSFFLEGIIQSTASPMPGRPYEVGAGLIDETKALAALDEALKDPAKVAAESNVMMQAARAKYGDQPAKPAKGMRMNPISALGAVLKRWVLPLFTLFLVPMD
ncbi:MAG: S8 family serine peptidase [Elusimicrobia bacterium]|nr:S8 family serine peptidase [Elusimicrobiota bacterium]